MGKATIIEAQNSNTVYEEGKTKGILGKLKGIFADYKNGTRNSGRHYTEELWDNRVFGSEDVMEALQTKTLFGELDHPEGDRCETLAQNAAITITKLEKRPDEGVIYGEAEILDTPTGRIVKALADSGAKLGISSRGMGEEIYENGENIIDPDTYDFITFDVVVTPANTKARVALTESKHLSLLKESLQKEVDTCETENQLNQLKTVLENINISNKNTLIEKVDSKLEILNKEVNKLSEGSKNLTIDLLKGKLAEAKQQIEENSNASEQLSSENLKLIEDKEFYTNSRNTLKEKIKEIRGLYIESKENVKRLVDENKEQKTQIVELENKLSENKQLVESKDITSKDLEKEVESLKQQLQEKETTYMNRLNKLMETNKILSEKLSNNRKEIENKDKENTELKSKVKQLENKQLSVNKTLVESKKLSEAQSKQWAQKVQSLEEQNKKLTEAQDRFSKLAFNPIGTVEALAENFNNTDGYSQEDIELYNALVNRN